MNAPCTIALVLTWDGSHLPLRSIPPAAREFLCEKAEANLPPRSKKLAELFARDAVGEIRICWVPRLNGGDNVFTPPFPTPDGLRISYRTTKVKKFGDVLGVVYRRAKNPK